MVYFRFATVLFHLHLLLIVLMVDKLLLFLLPFLEFLLLKLSGKASNL